MDSDDLRLARLEDRVMELRAEVFGPTGDPERPSVRARLQAMEAHRAAEHAADAVRAALRAEVASKSSKRERLWIGGAGLLLTALNVLLAHPFWS